MEISLKNLKNKIYGSKYLYVYGVTLGMKNPPIEPIALGWTCIHAHQNNFPHDPVVQQLNISPSILLLCVPCLVFFSFV